MSVRNHSSTARTSQCMSQRRKGDGHHYTGAAFDNHALSHTSGYPYEHLNHYPTATTAAGYGDWIKAYGTYLSSLNPMVGPFDPAGKIMENTIGFEPDFRGTSAQEYIPHALLELMRIGFNLVIAKKILDMAIQMSLNLFDGYGRVDMNTVQNILNRMGIRKNP